MTRIIKRYSELIRLPTFEERFAYLKLDGRVGESTFGGHRHLNQDFYRSDLWRKEIRNKIILRDNACDLGCEDRQIPNGSRLIIHHINPITLDDILENSDLITDPENLICVSYNTHQAIHYGDISLLPTGLVERRPGDTCPWR